MLTKLKQICLSDLAPLFNGDFGSNLLFVMSEDVRELLNLGDVDPEQAPKVEVLLWHGPESRIDLLERLKLLRKAGAFTSVLWIANNEFEHFSDAELESVKIVGLSGFSVPYTPESLRRTLAVVIETDYREQNCIEARVLEQLDDSSHIEFKSKTHQTSATFLHQTVEHWFSLHGGIGWGEQVVAPTGELSALTADSGDFNADVSFQLDGEIVLHGEPIVHRGSHEVSVDETANQHQALSSMRDHPVVLNVRAGRIEGIRPVNGASNVFAEALSRLLNADSRYAMIHEIGFGTNFRCANLIETNFFPNERFPGVHLGLGLGGHTKFHIDLVSKEIETFFVRNDLQSVSFRSVLGIPF